MPSPVGVAARLAAGLRARVPDLDDAALPEELDYGLTVFPAGVAALDLPFPDGRTLPRRKPGFSLYGAATSAS